MNRLKSTFYFPVEELENVKRRMLHWANQCNILLFLDSNRYEHTSGTYECICGAGAFSEIKNDDGHLQKLKSHFDKEKDWLFGNINYDFKNQTEHLFSSRKQNFEFEEISFFQPEHVCFIRRNENCVCIESLTTDPEMIWQEMCTQNFPNVNDAQATGPINFQKRIEQADYLKIINQLKAHIREGDCYEINFCNEAYCEGAIVNPLAAFEKLNHISPAPFAAFYKQNDQYLLSASPERYLRKEGNKIIAQPIKGTSKRATGIEGDKQQIAYLKNSIKERAEHVMIVDLMRNDLARFCEPDSVNVDELYGIYSFPQVHQMISTISGILKKDLSLFDAIRFSFPMGSMTGAPKIMVMQLIEQYEQSRRALFSGSVGYISPQGNFDFNVVIRSLFYNEKTNYLSYQTGGAITYDSDPQLEWEETLLKAAALEKALQ